MKQVIFVFLVVALFFGCHESNSVEPILDNSNQLNRQDGMPIQGQNTVSVRLSCEYNFNPDAADQQCGGLMSGTSLKYILDEPNGDGIHQRYIRRAQIYSPSKLEINGIIFNTYNIYSLNRKERVTSEGNVVSGKTWGTFRIVENRGTIPQKGSHNVVLFKGEFTGDILDNTTKIKLTGEGVETYRNYHLKATEKQNCTSSNGKLHCWTSAIKGRISVPIFSDK